MLRVIIFSAMIWCILVFCGGCSQNDGFGSKPQAGKPWVKVDDEQLASSAEETPKINAMTFYSTGLLMEEKKNYRGAAEKFVQAINADPNFISAYNQLGQMYINLRLYDQAEKTYCDAVKKKKDTSFLHNNLGFVYILQRKFPDAEKEFRLALKNDPNFFRAHNNLAVALTRQGKLDEALKHFNVSCSSSEANFNIAMILHAERKLDLAEKYFLASLKTDPDFEPAKQGLRQVREDKASPIGKIQTAKK